MGWSRYFRRLVSQYAIGGEIAVFSNIVAIIPVHSTPVKCFYWQFHATVLEFMWCYDIIVTINLWRGEEESLAYSSNRELAITVEEYV